MHISLLFTLESWIISILLIFGNVIIILNVPVLEIKMDLNYFDLSYKPRFDLKGIILTNHLSLNINLYGTEFMNSLVIVLQLSFLFYSNDSICTVLYSISGCWLVDYCKRWHQVNHVMYYGKERLVAKTLDQMVFNLCTIILLSCIQVICMGYRIMSKLAKNVNNWWLSLIF